MVNLVDVLNENTPNPSLIKVAQHWQEFISKHAAYTIPYNNSFPCTLRNGYNNITFLCQLVNYYILDHDTDDLGYIPTIEQVMEKFETSS